MGLNSDVTLNINANLDSLNKSIRAINKSMKFDLGVNIHNALKEATKGLREGLAKNAPTHEINQLKDKIREATKVELRFKLDQATNQLKNLVPQMLGTYATIKGLIGSPVSASLDFNTAINEINKFSHFSEQELAKFKKDMFSLGKSNGLDLNNILKIGELSAQLGVGKNELKDFTQNAINLKIGLGISQEEAVNYSSKISKAFHLNIKDLQVFSDEVAAMATSTKTSAKAILEVTKTTLAGAKAFGLSAKEASALSASFLSVGLDSSEASSSINKFFTELNNIDNATPAFHQALAKMGMDAEQLKEDIQSNPQVAIQNLFEDLNDLDDEERFGVISELFGKKMANNINSAKDGVKAFNLALEASKDSSGALQKAVDEAAGDGFGDSIIELKAAWSEFKVEFGNIFIPYLKSLFDWTRGLLGSITDFLHNNNWAKNLIGWSVGILAVVKSVGILKMAFSSFGTILFYPFQYLWKSLMISDTRFKFSTIIAKAYGFTLRDVGRGYASIKKGIFKASFALLVTFPIAIERSEFMMKLASLRANGFKKSILSLIPSFKQAGNGATLFSKVFKVAMFGVKMALASVGIGVALAVITGAAWLIMRYWKPVKAFFGGFFKGLYEGLAPIREAFSNLWTSIKTAFAPLAPLFSKIFGEVNNTEEELSSFAQAGLVVGKVIGGVISLIAKPFEYLIKAITLAFEWGGKLTSWLGDILGLGDDKKLEVNATKSIKGSLDETLARQNENKAKMLSQIQSSQTDNSRQIHDYKQITINTTGNAQEIARAINTYSYDDDDNL